MPAPTVLILGATGRTGRHLLDAALEAGYRVHALVRDPGRLIISHPHCTLFQGSPADPTALASAFEGCGYVLSCLNISRKNDFPWAPLRTPPTLLSDVMQSLLELHQQQGIKRMVICSAWGVAETRDYIPGWFKWVIDHSNVGAAYQDHERQEVLLTASKLPWTLVRPVGLTFSLTPQTVKESYDNQPRPRLTISRKSLARFMVEALDRDELIHKKPVIFAGK